MIAEVVVIGGGYAGAATVNTLQRMNAPVSITWISDSPFHVVRHEMHRVIRHPHLLSSLRIPLERIASAEVTCRTATVTELRPERREVGLGAGEYLPYDYLVVTVGCRMPYYGIPGLKSQAIPMQSIEDARTIHGVIRDADVESQDIVVGGGGLTGVQTAGEIVELRDQLDVEMSVTIVEALDSVLPTSKPPLQHRVRRALRDHGVTIIEGEPIVSTSPTTVTLADERELGYDRLVWAGGIAGREFIDVASLETQRTRLVTDDRLRTSDPHVFAVGDIALIDQEHGVAPPTAQAAWQAGPVAARNVAAAVADEPLESWQFDDKGSLISIGSAAIAHDVVGIPVETFGGPAAASLKKLVGTRWIASLTSWREAARLWSYL